MVVNSTNENTDLLLKPTNFDATIVSDIVNFIIGFKASTGQAFAKPYTSTYKIAYTTTSSTYYYTEVNVINKDRIDLRGYTYNYVLNTTFTKSGTYIIKNKVLSPVGFVIGNNASQYPTDGQKGDYWYELIGQVASTNALSLTDDATNLIKNIAVEEIKREVILNVD